MKKVTRILLFSLMFLTYPLFASASAVPAMPLLVYGNVEIDASSAPIGTIINVKKSDIIIANTTTTEVGEYFVEIVADTGDSLSYFVGDILSSTIIYVDPWQTPSQNTDLSVTTPAPAPAPPPLGAGAGYTDTTPPTNISIQINNGDAITISTDVTLTLTATGATSMTVSNDSAFTSASWETYSTTKEWVLDSVPGEKIVYIKFIDGSNNATSPISDTIVYGEVLGVKTTKVSVVTREPDKWGQEGSETPVPTLFGQEQDPQILQVIADVASILSGDLEAMLLNVEAVRDVVVEETTRNTYVTDLLGASSNLSQEAINNITNYIAYGTPGTLSLGAGERAGAINSYKSAFGRLPQTEEEWSDALKIAVGRWPSERSEEAETRAAETFSRIYLREADRTNPNDDAAVTVMAYGLRPSNRNLDSEKTAIKTFRAIFGFYPSSAVNWDAVRAIAYSGAIR